MGAFKDAIITKKGHELIYKAVFNGATVEFSKIKTSDAVLGDNLAYLTDLGSIKQEESVASVIREDDTTVKVSATFSNKELTEGYYVRAVGLYAIDPDEGEILYSISVADEETATADWMPPFTNIGVSSLILDLVTAVGSASSVNLTVDPSTYATIAQVEDLQEQIDTVRSFIGYSEEGIYGIEVDFASQTISRIAGAENLTAGADFDKIEAWGGRKRCILTDDGVRLAYYGEQGYTETGALTEGITVNGTKYPVGTFVQVMVEQPIFYVKAVPVTAKNATSGRGKQYVKARFYISTTPQSGFSAPRAFYDDKGILQDKIYLSAYESCPYIGYTGKYANDATISAITYTDTVILSSVAGYRAQSGVSANFSRVEARKYATRRGAGWRLHNIWAMAVTEWLFMIEYASLDPQRAVGQGVCTLADTPSTDNLSLKTGATAELGNASGIPADGVDGRCSVTYRGEENLWGNIWTWLDGVNIRANGVNEIWVAKIGTAPTDSTTEGYERLAFNASHTTGYLSAFGIDERYPELLIPTEAGGSDTFADHIYQNHTYEGFCVALFGNKWSAETRCGFTLALDVNSSYDNRDIGARVMYVPQT